MSWRITVSRAVAAAQQTTPTRRSASARTSGPYPARDAAPVRSETFDAERARARTLPRIPAMHTLTDRRRVTAPAHRALTLVRPPSFGALDREHLARRLLNVAVAAAGLVLAAPLMLLIALLIKLTSRGSVLFTQTRVGLDRRALSNAGGNTRRHTDVGGKPFTMYKFRTMRPADTNGPQVWAQPDDDRVTPIGRALRKFRLDELPQLFNVLRGDMNIVGPRPEQPTIFVTLREEIQGYQRRQRVRPGITGWAQINQGYDTSLDDVRRKVAYDLEYIRRQSALEDLRIMMRTVPVMVMRRGGW